MEKICIICGNKKAYAKILDKNPRTVEKILDNLPLEGKAIKWGKNIIFIQILKLMKKIVKQKWK